jgi:hypothetical protein
MLKVSAAGLSAEVGEMVGEEGNITMAVLDKVEGSTTVVVLDGVEGNNTVQCSMKWKA